MTITERSFSLPDPYHAAAVSAHQAPLRAPSRFPVVGRTTKTNEPIIGRINHGEWVILQDGRVASPSGSLILEGRLALSAPAMDFDLLRVRDGSLHSLVRGLLESAPDAAARNPRTGTPSPLPRETPSHPPVDFEPLPAGSASMRSW